MAKYYEFKQGIQKCIKCGWTGLGEETGVYEMFRDLYEASCPKCEEKIGIVEFPYLSEMKENYDKLGPGDKMAITLIENRTSKFEKEKLKSPDQLPDIDESFIILTWDTDSESGPGNVLIKHGSRVIWKELEFYEGYWRFKEIGDILKKKYGDRIKDLVPTKRSEGDLYGDHLGAPYQVDAFRKSFTERGKENKYKGQSSFA